MLTNNNSIILKLTEFCIETTAKKRIKQLGNAVLSDENEVGEDILEELEFLRIFIQETDFAKLRNSNPLLRGDNSVSVLISKTADSFKVTII